MDKNYKIILKENYRETILDERQCSDLILLLKWLEINNRTQTIIIWS